MTKCPVCQKPLVDGNCPDGHRFWAANPGPQSRFLSSSVWEVLYGGAAGGGKDLPLTAPIPTPLGWTTMGELRAGDAVFDADGSIVRVTGVFDAPRSQLWRLMFDDGESMVAGSDHRWLTQTDAERMSVTRASVEWRAARRAKRPSRATGKRSAVFTAAVSARNSANASVAERPARGTVRTTQEIVDTLRVGKRVNHSISNPSPIDLPHTDLVLESYVLGAWLGDGASKAGQVFGLDEEVFANIEAAGFVVTPYADGVARGIRGLQKILKSLGVFGHKHIPQLYLRASIAQRVALLQGLCDTDGHATEKGSIEFTTTAIALRDGIMELLASLGIKASCREGRATLYGRDISAKWRIQFWTEIPCFRIARKLARQKLSGFRGCHSRRYIVGAEAVPYEPTRCIAVDSPSRTYLAGKMMVVTHNTDALVMMPMRWVHLPYFRGLILRRSFPELEKTVIERSHQLYPIAYPEARYHGSKHQWSFPSGATISFSYLSGDQDLERFQGAAYSVVCFDELTHFSKKQYLYLFSRVRSPHGYATRIRAATNPGGVGHIWVMQRFAPWLDRSPEYIRDGGIQASPGQVLYASSSDDGVEEFRTSRPTLEDVPKFISAQSGDAARMWLRQWQSRTFIPAVISDNVQLVRNDPGYAARLNALDPLTRKQLRDGNWLARAAKGILFRRSFFETVSQSHAIGTKVRYWDRAASEDGDYTVGCKMGRAPAPGGFVYWVENIVRFRARPAEVERMIRKTAEADGIQCSIGIEQDPGQAGVFESDYYVKALVGYHVKRYRVSKNKTTRSLPASAQAEAGNIKLVKGEWNDAFLAEVEDFPEGSYDDQVDAFSGAFNMIVTGLPPSLGAFGNYQASMPKPRM